MAQAHLHELQLRQGMSFEGVAVQGALESVVEAGGGRHHQDALDADRSEADHEAVDHVALLDVVEDRGTRHQPSYVAPGGGVGDDTDGYGAGHGSLLRTPHF